MDYAKAFTFVFDDLRWKEKVAIGTGVALVGFLPVIGILVLFIVAGYSIRLLQNVRDGNETPLPEWDDWAEDFMRGLKLAVVAFIWALPLIVFALPVGIGAGLAENNGAAAWFGTSILLCATCFMLLYALFVAAASPGFYIAFATNERINSGLQFTKIWHWSWNNIGHVLVAILIIIVAQIVFGITASFVGIILCGIGLIVTMPLATFAIAVYQNHVYGQLAYNSPYDGIGGPGAYVPDAPTDLAVSQEYTAVSPEYSDTEEADIENADIEDRYIIETAAEPTDDAGADDLPAEDDGKPAP